MQSKLILALICCLCVSTGAGAQFSKGRRMLGAGIGTAFFNSTHSEYSYAPPASLTASSDRRAYGISFSPDLGWFISAKTVVGAHLLLNYTSDKKTDESQGSTFNKEENNNFSVGIGGFGRTYFADNGKLLPFGQLNLAVGTGSAHTKGFTYTTSYRDDKDAKSSGQLNLSAGAALGVTRMLNQYAGIDFMLGYTFIHYKQNYTATTLRDVGMDGVTDEQIISKYSQKSYEHGITIAVGVQVYLGGKSDRK